MKPTTAHRDIAEQLPRGEVSDEWRRWLLADQISSVELVERATETAIIDANLFDPPHFSRLPQREAEGLLISGELGFCENVCECPELALIARRRAARQAGARI